MKKLLVLVVCALQFLPTSALAGPEADGHGKRITLWDQDATGQDQAAVKALKDATAPVGTPRIAARGRGDRPPVPAIGYRPGIGACMTSGSSALILEPLIQRSFTFPGCPSQAGSGGGTRPAAPPPPTPLEAAYQVWYWQTDLPSPTLAASPPNGAVTGLDFYLSIGGPQRLAFDVPALGYNVHLEVSSVYDVDWGEPAPDGTRLGQAITKGHRTQGGPYPNGDLRHQYIQRGSATIDVTQRWTATWSAGGESGTIADRLATSGTMTVPVQEIQAVLRP